MAETFDAGVQYGDWKGECHADNRDKNDIWDYLRSRNLLRPGEIVIGFSAFSGENMTHGAAEIKPFRVRVHAIPAQNADAAKAMIDGLDDEEPVTVREIRFDLTPEEFVGLFKRIKIALALRATSSYVGRQYEVTEE